MNVAEKLERKFIEAIKESELKVPIDQIKAINVFQTVKKELDKILKTTPFMIKGEVMKICSKVFLAVSEEYEKIDVKNSKFMN